MAKYWQKSGFLAKFFDEICTFWRTKKGIFGGKIIWSLSMTIAVQRKRFC